MENNNTKLPFLIIAIAFVILVVGFLFYLFYFKPKQEKQKIEAQKQNLEDIYKETFGDLPAPEKPIEQLTGEERVQKEAELAYQSCFDKTENLNEPINGMITNKYRVEWNGDSTGGWEMRFTDWLVKKYPDFCNEFDLNKIKLFLDKKREEYGDDFSTFKD